MAVNFEFPMTWKDFRALEKQDQHDYLQHLIDTYGANVASFAQMFHNNANTVRRYLADNELGIQLSRGSRVDRTRWNEFLGIQETVEEPAVTPEVKLQPVPSGMRRSVPPPCAFAARLM